MFNSEVIFFWFSSLIVKELESDFKSFLTIYTKDSSQISKSFEENWRLPDSLGQVSFLKMVSRTSCTNLKTLPESLVNLKRHCHKDTDELKLLAAEFFQRRKAEPMRQYVRGCPSPDKSVLQSFGWIYVCVPGFWVLSKETGH